MAKLSPPYNHQQLQQQVSPSPQTVDVHLHLRRLKQALTCSICLRVMQKAHCLPCMHHFCGSCLSSTLMEMAACLKCKCPATIRQVRASPEIDNVISIYQSLKTATEHKYRLPQHPGWENSHLDFPHSPQTEAPTELIRHDFEGHHYQGILPASKRVQLPCPYSRNADELQEEEHYEPKFERIGLSRDSVRTTKMSNNISEHGNNKSEAIVGHMCKAMNMTGDHRCSKMSMHEATSVKSPENVIHDASFCNGNTAMALWAESEIVDSKSQDWKPLSNSMEMHKKRSFHAPHSQMGVNSRPVTNMIVDCGANSSGAKILHYGDTFASLDHKGFEAKPYGEDTEPGIKDVKESCMQENDCLNCNQDTCAFCQTSDNLIAGPIVHYKDGIPVKVGRRSANYCSVHKSCAEWAPNVYYEGDVAKNLSQEIARGQKIKCSECGLKGAVLGCCVKRCRKSYHYPCAHSLLCRWDEVNFLVLCPDHATSRFPGESAHKRTKTVIDKKSKIIASENRDDMEVKSSTETIVQSNSEHISERSAKLSPFAVASEWVLCCSGLDDKANDLVSYFLSCTGAKFSKQWSSSVTHLITGTDDKGAARRTFKYLMATLEGRWILRVDWLAMSMAAGQPLSEESYEVNLDIHGMTGGPQHGRFMAVSKPHKLFEGLSFYLLGSYKDAYKADLQALVIAAGGGLLTQMPEIEEDGAPGSTSFSIVIYSTDMFPDVNAHHIDKVIQDRRAEGRAIAAQAGAKLAAHTWILDSIAAYGLQQFD